MNGNYYVRIRGKIMGPFSWENLQKLHAQGQVTGFHEVSQDGTTWGTFSSLLQSLAPKPPIGPLPNPPTVSEDNEYKGRQKKSRQHRQSTFEELESNSSEERERQKERRERQKNQNLVMSAYWFCSLSIATPIVFYLLAFLFVKKTFLTLGLVLFLFGHFTMGIFSLLGIIFGIINCIRGEVGHGVSQILLAIFLPIFLVITIIFIFEQPLLPTLNHPIWN